MARKKRRAGKGKASKCAGRTAKGRLRKGYKIKKGHSCPVKA